MALSLFIPKRTVLLISDDALYIYASETTGVRLVETVLWDAQNFSKNVTDIIVRECKKRPVLLLNDMVEQHYRKERVLRTGVGALDRAAMLKRRLSVSFGKYPVRGALPTKEKTAKTAGMPASDVYIFAAMPDSEQLKNSMNAVQDSMVSISGLCLLPVESASMVKALSQKLAGKPKDTALWSIFIGQHKSGNLRQIVTRDGELALTRMSPFSADRQDSVLWAQEVHKELKATMSYLARFGYDPDDGLSVIVISDSAAAETLEGLVEEECSLNILNLGEAAKALGLKVSIQEDQASAEVLHIAWAAQKTRFLLPMKAGRVDAVHRPRQIAMAATFILLAGGLFQGYQFANQLSGLSEAYDGIDSVTKRKVQLDSQYQREVQRKEAMGFDIRLVQSSIAVYDDLEARNIKALYLFEGIGKALGKDLRVDSVELARPRFNALSNFVKKKSEAPLFETRMKMTYPGTTNIDQGNKEVRELRNRLAIVLKGHVVKVVKFLKDYEYTEGLVVETGDLEKENLQQDFVAEILIQGPPLKEGEKL